jgi:hypothetical protein
MDRMVGDLRENVAQVGLGVEAVEDRGLDQGVEDRGAPATGVGTSEEVVLATEGDAWGDWS